jgi:hypothetical protein
MRPYKRTAEGWWEHFFFLFDFLYFSLRNRLKWKEPSKAVTISCHVITSQTIILLHPKTQFNLKRTYSISSTLSFDEKKATERNVGEIDSVFLRVNWFFGNNKTIVWNGILWYDRLRPCWAFSLQRFRRLVFKNIKVIILYNWSK